MRETLALPDLWKTWNFDPSILIPLVVTVFLYELGVWNIWRRAGVGHGITVWHHMSFLGAILTLLLALISPLDILSDDLFSAHMTQHLILILIVAPLLLLGN